MPQYALPLALPAIFSADTFVVSDGNRDAFRWISAWPDWPSHAFYLHGPRACGKSHLGHIWAGKANARALPANLLPQSDIASLSGNWLVEDIEQLSRPEALLHLFNMAREHKHFLLLTGQYPALELPLPLPDLRSRLLALPAAHISQADDALLAAILRKQFADRQLKVDEELIAYLLPRVDRSFIHIKELIESLDRAALASHKKLTIPFVRQFLSLPPRADY